MCLYISCVFSSRCPCKDFSTLLPVIVLDVLFEHHPSSVQVKYSIKSLPKPISICMISRIPYNMGLVAPEVPKFRFPSHHLKPIGSISAAHPVGCCELYVLNDQQNDKNPKETVPPASTCNMYRIQMDSKHLCLFSICGDATHSTSMFHVPLARGI